MDLCHIQKCILTMKQKDVSACYNRIIANNVFINRQREGLPQKVCKLRVNTLNESR